MTGEQARWGYENLALDQKKLDALGFAGVMRPISTSCADHRGAAIARLHTWDGSKWVFSSDWIEADQSIIKPMIKAAADKYAAEKKITRRTAEDCQQLHRLAPCPPRPRGGVSHPEPSSKRRLLRRSRRAESCQGARACPNILLNVNGIEVIYNHVILVLKGVSLQVPEGGVVALLGGNGAGKTTTLRAVSNLLRRRARRGHQGQRSSCAASASKDCPLPTWCSAA